MKPFDKVYGVVKKIPKGKVSTYKSVAKLAGIKNPRVIGFALHANKNPDEIPCHRVVKSNGYLAKGYAFGGIKTQEKILRKEGVIFLKTHLIDLNKSLY